MDPEPADTALAKIPGTTTSGFTVHEPGDRQNDPRAGDPKYIYLEKDRDAVRLTGPVFEFDTTAARPGWLFVEDPTIESFLWGPNPWDDGLRITVNPHLQFELEMTDFELEGWPVAEIELAWKPGVGVESHIVFLGNGEPGVVHELRIIAILDGERSQPTEPVWIEVREPLP
jgi:hypothetical protein